MRETASLRLLGEKRAKTSSQTPRYACLVNHGKLLKAYKYTVQRCEISRELPEFEQ